METLFDDYDDGLGPVTLPSSDQASDAECDQEMLGEQALMLAPLESDSDSSSGYDTDSSDDDVHEVVTLASLRQKASEEEKRRRQRSQHRWQCRNCNREGHTTDECPFTIRNVCFRCGGDHPMQVCTGVLCKVCGKWGHLPQHCNAKGKSRPRVRCPICGDRHRLMHCPAAQCLWDGGLTIQQQFGISKSLPLPPRQHDHHGRSRAAPSVSPTPLKKSSGKDHHKKSKKRLTKAQQSLSSIVTPPHLTSKPRSKAPQFEGKDSRSRKRSKRTGLPAGEGWGYQHRLVKRPQMPESKPPNTKSRGWGFPSHEGLPPPGWPFTSPNLKRRPKTKKKRKNTGKK